jgi:hypothetical protein
MHKSGISKKRIFTALLFIGIAIFAAGVQMRSETTGQSNDWTAWKYRLPVRLAGLTELVARLVPVDVKFTLKTAECPNPEKNIRLIYRARDGREQGVPFQLSRLRVWDKGLDPKVGEPTLNGMITFFDVSGGQAGGNYFILYGNSGAEAPAYPTDLVVSGKGPAWTIENSRLKVELRKEDPVKPEILHDVFGDCGQIAVVTLKAKPETPISNKDHTLHWNPGILIPERGWSNAHAWDPPEHYEVEKGPIFVEVRRRGALPYVPEVELTITYRFFAGRDYVWYGAVLRVKDDVGVVSLRTNELVFDEGFFTRLAWEDEGKIHDEALGGFKAVNKHGDILRLRPDVPFLAVYDPAKGLGTATINLNYAAIDPRGRIPDKYDQAFFVVKGEGLIGSGGLLFWFRSFFNFAPEWDRRQRFILPAGYICAEQSLFHFFEAGGPAPVKDVAALSTAARDLSKLDIQVGPYPFATSDKQ